MMARYRDYRCPHCKSDSCGNDAVSGWDVVRQESNLLSEFDTQWCSDCGDVRLEEFEITDPAERARIDAARAVLAVEAAAPQLLAGANAALVALRELTTNGENHAASAAIEQLVAAIAAARPKPFAEGTPR